MGAKVDEGTFSTKTGIAEIHARCGWSGWMERGIVRARGPETERGGIGVVPHGVGDSVTAAGHGSLCWSREVRESSSSP